jgi:hypothetical protein
MRILVCTFFLAALFAGPVAAQSSPSVLVDDFEEYDDQSLPDRWKYLDEGKLVPLESRHMRPNERFFVVDDAGNKVLRVYTNGEAVHLSMVNEAEGFDWDVRSHPRIAWDWRANKLPGDAREDQERLNDTAAGLYVIFAMDGLFIRRPRAIKYAYSTTLPVGTLVSYGSLKVIVVSSGLDGIGSWRHVERDVHADYRRAFGGEPPRRPLSLRLWGDSDNTDSEAEADFDNIMFLGPAGS